jgi:transcriptional regulator with XRE-family HTH domain
MNGDSTGADSVWSREADEREAPLPKIGRYPAGGLVRRARRIADLSQRELARRTGLSPSTVARIETGEIAPSLEVMQRILDAAGLSLVVVDRDGHVVQPMRDVADIHDGADRRYPAHLDTILDPRPGEWWADQYGLARPPETFYRDRRRRDALRALSQWEVRVKLYRGAPPPPDPDAHHRRMAAIRAATRPRDVPLPFPTDELDVDEWDPAWYAPETPDDQAVESVERPEDPRRRELRRRVAGYDE